MANKKNKSSRWQKFWKQVKKIAKDHFVPHSGNAHVPHVLHHRALFGYSVLLVVLKVFALVVIISFPSSSVLSSAITPENIIDLTNQTRRSLDLPELKTNTKLMSAAQAKAEDMFLNGYFAHTSPTGVTPWYWFEVNGYDYRSAGENLAAHFHEAEDVTAGWLASPTHRDNIVNTRYADIGVGVARGVFDNYETTFVVQMFGYENPADGIANDQQPSTQMPVTVLTTPELKATAVNNATALETTPDSDVVTATDTEKSKNPYLLTVDLNTLELKPLKNAYSVNINMQNVAQATLHLGSERSPFTSTNDADNWHTVIPYNPAVLGTSGERMYVVATGLDGQQSLQELAIIMPQADASQIYAFKTSDNPKFLGLIDAGNVDDLVHKIYLYTLLLIGGALLVAVLIKFEIKKPRLVTHTLAVLALGLLLMAI